MKKKWNRGMCFLMTLALGGAQVAECGILTAHAQSLEYEGTTQFSTSDVYPSMDTSAVELVVEEVYASSGSYLEEGGNVLKLTDDSYQEALDYYSAAIIYAQNNLINVQMEYEKAVQEAQYTYEIAVAEADQADFIREQQIEELESTIEEHEEVMSELEEAIEEYEEGIANGSYTTSSSSSSSSNSSNSNSSKNSQKESETELESEMMSESELQSESEGQSESELQSESGLPGESEGQSESNKQSESNDQSESNEQSESSDQSESTDQSESETETSELDAKITTAEEKVATLKTALTELEKQAEEKDNKYNEILKKIYKAAGIEVTDFCGVGGTTSETESSASLVANETTKTSSADEKETELP